MSEERKVLYERTCSAMASAIQKLRAAHPSFTPQFALPPQDIPVLACIDQVPTIARNEDARQLIELFCRLGQRIGGPGGQPSLLMLEVVLEHEQVPFERVSLEELGLHLIRHSGEG
jgi:hypothetical protein